MLDLAVLTQDITQDLGNIEVMFTSDMTLEAAQRFSMSRSILKKYEDGADAGADKACEVLFQLNNSLCRDRTLQPSTLQDEEVISNVKTFFDNLVHCGPELTTLTDVVYKHIDVGPGASQGATSLNFYSKLYDSPLTGTNDLLLWHYRRATLSNPRSFCAEMQRDAEHGYRCVVGNRFSTVPKTFLIKRGICTEPSLNMLFQKGIGAWFTQVLREKFNINLSWQPVRNRALARLGSIDGKYCTIDLSCASDSIALSVLQKIFPREILKWIELSRSPFVTFPSGVTEELYMVGSMGNGFTFPLQTLLFASIVRACYITLGIKPEFDAKGPLNFAVFGDDIIVEKSAYHFVVRALQMFGFTVNEDKSFYSGSFRESCGGDYWKGHDVRGVYIRSLKNDSKVYSAINRIIKWSARTGILMPLTVKRLRDMVEHLPIPRSAGESEGIRVPYVPPSLSKRTKTNGVVYYALVPVQEEFSVPYDGSDEWHLPYKGKPRRVSYNPDGLLLSFLRGHIRNSWPDVLPGVTHVTQVTGVHYRKREPKLGVRPDKDPSKFRLMRRVCYNWGSGSVISPLQDRLFNYARYGAPQHPELDVKPALSAEFAELIARDRDWEVMVDLYLN